ncbi:iron-sulfur cluster assembly protein, partial [Propylenella binzhouense]
MGELSKDAVQEALRQVKGPDGQQDVVSLGLVSDIVVSDGKVIFSITVPAERARELEPMRAAAERAVRAVPGVQQAMVALTAERRPGSAPAPAPRGSPMAAG